MLRKIVKGMVAVGMVLGAGALGAACLDRPVTAQAPTIKTNFTTAVNQSGINKVDILFDIDNSASMGDKQNYLKQAIPQMIARLVTPECVDAMGNPNGTNASPTSGQCATGTPEFTAVHDMHIGIVTSSLGSRLGIAAGTGASAEYVCAPNAPNVTSAVGGTSVSPFNDDQGHLINRTSPFGAGAALGPAIDTSANGTSGTLSTNTGSSNTPGGFLYWFPALGNSGASPVSPPESPYTAIGAAGMSGTLVGDFTELVGGVGESGCGIESQLESWYRFLVQPDPYLTLVNNNGVATWSGVDTTIIQQRHDFLRPDSLLAIIVLSDENDSEIDVRSYSGSGYLFMSDTYSPPRGVSACQTDPNSTACTQCPSSGSSDPACINGGVYTESADSNDWGGNLNLRHVHMPQKYGLNPQFPLTRYYVGLTSATVPNRVGEYPSTSDSYTGTPNCSNPIFAKVLPQASDVPDFADPTPAEIAPGQALCTLSGQGLAVRQASDVFYAHIGGVPHQLLQVNAAQCEADGCKGLTSDPPSCATDANCQQKDTLASTDWTSILGTGPASYTGAGGPLNYDYTGIDPHMIESMTPRNLSGQPNSLPTPASSPAVSTLSGPTFTGNPAPDPINGREWVTNTGTHSLLVDREYACIFQLPVTFPDGSAGQRDCAKLPADTIEGNSCDCVPGYSDATPPVAIATGNSLSEVPPLCALQSSDNPPSITSSVSDYTVQVYAKAYPTTRELMLANMMGGQGIVSSLCPIHTTDTSANQDDPTYGYRPAVNTIVNRLKNALGSTCVPELTPVANPDGGTSIPCLVLVTFGPNVSNPPGSPADCANYPNANGPYEPVNPSGESNDAGVLGAFNAQQHALVGDAAGAVDLSKYTTCAMKQISLPPNDPTATCVNGSSPGWCYISGAAITGGSTCSQEIVYSDPSIVPNGATVNLECVAANNSASDAAGH
jgi:hypothetical protein